MAKIESSYININRLNAGGQPARGLRSFDGSKVNKHRRAYVNDGVRNVIVYDELRTTLITPDEVIKIDSKGGSLLKPEVEGDVPRSLKDGNVYYAIASKIESFSLDAENLQNELPYILTNTNHDQYDPGGITDPNSISPNTDKEQTRKYIISVTQAFTGQSANITVEQDAEEIKETWTDLYVDDSKGKYGIRLYSPKLSELGGDNWEDLKVSANGESQIEVQVYAVQQKIFTSTSGESDGNQTFEGWITVDSIDGFSHNGGALNKWHIGYIGANNLGTNPTNGPELIYDIKEVSFKGYDGENYTWNIYSGNSQLGGGYAEMVSVYQEANIETLENNGTSTYVFNLFDESNIILDSPSARNYELSFESYISQPRRYVYTSGAVNENAPALITYKNCSIVLKSDSYSYASLGDFGNIYDISSSSYAKVRIFANTNQNSGRTINLYIDDYNGNRHDIKFTQPQDVWITQLTSVTFNRLIIEFEGENIIKEGISLIPASGGTVKIYASLNRNYSMISQATGESMDSYSNPTTADKVGIVTGTKGGNVTAGSESDYIYITYPNLGSDMSINNNNYELSSIKWILGDKSDTYNRGDNGGDYLFNMSQEQNVIIGSTYDSYAINLTYNNSGSTFSDADEFTIMNDGLNHNGSYHRVKVDSCTRKKYNTYASGYKDTTGTQENTTATISVSLNNSIGNYLRTNASVSLVQTLDVNSGSEFLFVPGGNTTSSNRVFTMYGKCKNDTSIQDIIKFTQSPASYAITVDPIKVIFEYSGGSTKVTIEPLINGHVVTASPTVLSNPSWVTVDMTNWIDDSSALISANSNVGGTSNPARSGDVVFKHPQSSDTVTLTVSQKGYTSPGGGGSDTSVEIEAWKESYGKIGYQLFFDGIIKNPITIKVQDSADEWSNVLAEKEEDNTPFNGSLVGNILVLNPAPTMYVHAYLNGKNIGYGMVQ